MLYINVSEQREKTLYSSFRERLGMPRRANSKSKGKAPKDSVVKLFDAYPTYVEDERIPYSSPSADVPDYPLENLKQILLKSDICFAILARAVDDTLRTMKEIVPLVPNPDETQLQIALDFLQKPNPDSFGLKWAETSIFDYAGLGTAFIEMVGSNDGEIKVTFEGTQTSVRTFGGTLEAVYEIDAATVVPMPDANGRLPKSPDPAFYQRVGKDKVYYTQDKIKMVSKMTLGLSLMGYPPLMAILQQLYNYGKMQNYTGDTFSGKIPRSILKTGKMPAASFTRFEKDFQNSLANSNSTYGLTLVNGADLNLLRIMDPPKETAFLELIRMNREEICAVYGCPPIKLGIVETGKLSNPEQQLDTWYDMIEGIQVMLEQVINYIIYPKMGVTDYAVKFNSPRPDDYDKKARAFFQVSQALSYLNNENVKIVSVNEARSILNDYVFDNRKKLPPLDDGDSNQATQPGEGAGDKPATPTDSTKEPELRGDQKDLFDGLQSVTKRHADILYAKWVEFGYSVGVALSKYLLDTHKSTDVSYRDFNYDKLRADVKTIVLECLESESPDFQLMYRDAFNDGYQTVEKVASQEIVRGDDYLACQSASISLSTSKAVAIADRYVSLVEDALRLSIRRNNEWVKTLSDICNLLNGSQETLSIYESISDEQARVLVVAAENRACETLGHKDFIVRGPFSLPNAEVIYRVKSDG